LAYYVDVPPAEDQRQHHHHPVLGVLLKLISVVLFSTMAACVKYLGAEIPIGEIIFARGLISIIVLALIAWSTAGLESYPPLAAHWLPIWLIAAVVSCTLALFFMETKARKQGLSLRRTVAVRFFLTLAPAFVAGGVLTVALQDVVARDVIAGIWLLLYGVGIAACGVFSIPVVLIAGFAFMGLGTVTLAAPPEWAPAMLAVGFGGIHIALGAIILKDHGG